MQVTLPSRASAVLHIPHPPISPDIRSITASAHSLVSGLWICTVQHQGHVDSSQVSVALTIHSFLPGSTKRNILSK